MPMPHTADSPLSSAGLLAGRLLLSLIFVHEGLSLIDSYSPAVAYVQKFGLSATLLPAVILLQLGWQRALRRSCLPRSARSLHCSSTGSLPMAISCSTSKRIWPSPADFLRWPPPGRGTGRSASTSICLTTRDEAFFTRSDIRCGRRRGVYICPNGKQLKTSGTVHDGRTLIYRDCNACPLMAKCCTREEAHKTPRDFHEDARDVHGAR